MKNSKHRPPQPAKRVESLLSVPHGSINPVELENWHVDPEMVVDFSVNSNPFGPSRSVYYKLTHVPLSCYPDPDTLAVRRCLQKLHEVPIEQILVGNGTAELLWLIALAFLDVNDPVLIVGPTFGEYANTVRLMQAQITEVQATDVNAFTVPVPQVTEALSSKAWRVVYLCNPNNPTGAVVDASVIHTWVVQHPHTLFVIDEAYIDFVEGLPSSILLEANNVIVLRSMTKAHGLAGLRLGYAVGHADVIQALKQVCPPWSVNAMAQVAGVATLGDADYLQRSMTQLSLLKETFVAALTDLGLSPMPSQTHYFLVNVGNAANFRHQLLMRGVVVRDCASFGLPAYVRISTRTERENQYFIEQLRKIL
ncbi:MAG: histidinol-phosphate transaminase [Chloroflexota bacterium]